MKTVLLLLASAWALTAAETWTPLFDGRTLSGWRPCNSAAEFKVSGGAIVSPAGAGALCTDRDYGDFILEFEARNAAAEVRGSYKVGPAKDSGWTRYRVVADGDRVRTFVNGTPAADDVIAGDLSGTIRLRAGAAPGSWRHLRIQDLGRHAWKPLWDGRTFDGWTKQGGGNWSIEDGALHAKYVQGDERVGMLVGTRSFDDLTARVRFKIVQGNSGFFLRTDPETMASYEVEIDAEKRTGGLWEVRGRNWVTGPEDNAHVLAGGWNELTASLHGRRIVFHLNGVKTVDLPDDTAGRSSGVIALQVHGAKRPSEIWFKYVAVLEKQ